MFLQSYIYKVIEHQAKQVDDSNLKRLTEHCASYCDTSKGSKTFHDPVPKSQDSIHIHIYKHEAELARSIPRHWQYVGFGLSDLYNYNSLFTKIIQFCVKANVDLPQIYPLGQNGFGFELTFRLICDSDDDWKQEAPDWPCFMLQDLARYVLKSKNTLGIGDTFSYPSGKFPEGLTTPVKDFYMLMTLDPELGIASTASGDVAFIQIVRVNHKEYKAARELNAKSVLNAMERNIDTGGPLLVTDCTRTISIFDLDMGLEHNFKEEVSRLGSNIAQVSAKLKFSSNRHDWFEKVEEYLQREKRGEIQETDILLVKNELLVNDQCNNGRFDCPSRISNESDVGMVVENAELLGTKILDNIYLLLDCETARKLPLMIINRIAHGKKASFKDPSGELLTTLIPAEHEQASYVEPNQPYVKKGPWLQIYVPKELKDELTNSICLDFQDNFQQPNLLPKNYSWPEFKFYITVINKF